MGLGPTTSGLTYQRSINCRGNVGRWFESNSSQIFVVQSQSTNLKKNWWNTVYHKLSTWANSESTITNEFLIIKIQFRLQTVVNPCINTASAYPTNGISYQDVFYLIFHNLIFKSFWSYEILFYSATYFRKRYSLMHKNKHYKLLKIHTATLNISNCCPQIILWLLLFSWSELRWKLSGFGGKRGYKFSVRALYWSPQRIYIYIFFFGEPPDFSVVVLLYNL